MNEVSPVAKPSPFHHGEVRLQEGLGVSERMAAFGRRAIRDVIPDQHRAFYGQLPFIVAGTVDPAGDTWATLITNRPGFLASPDRRTLSVSARRDPTDPADAGLESGDAVGLLGIELHTRRRNRMNGMVRRTDALGFDVTVVHAFGNCPQYIQHRDFQFVTTASDASSANADVLQRRDQLDARDLAIITGADTFFVASYVDLDDGQRQVDVSHRGGKTGFVRIDEDGGLTIPDFAGNLHFNTLGNVLLNPKVGLVFPDFETGDMLQMSGDAEIILDHPEIVAFQGAERLWRFRPRVIVRRPAALGLRWRLAENGWSPNTLMTGSWEGAAERLKAEARRTQWRPFRITQIVDESRRIRSFHLVPADGAGLIPHLAGQHLPIRITPPGSDRPVVRTYTLSTAPSDGVYRISVRKQGLISDQLHTSVKVGDSLEARAPAGAFTIDASERRPAVLVAAGVGITPMLAMLRHVVFEGLRTRRTRPTWLFYATRSLSERAFDAEIAALVRQSGGAVRLVRILSQDLGAEPERDYDFLGRLDVTAFQTALPFDDYDFYLCGPPAFMQATYDSLRGLNVADSRLHAEAFGPASLTRTLDAGREPVPQIAASSVPVSVAFAASGKEARWTPGSGSLLELAEARGMTPEFSCRGGSCGSCKTRILEGAVAYTNVPTAPLGEGEVLICCSVPADASQGGSDRLILDI